MDYKNFGKAIAEFYFQTGFNNKSKSDIDCEMYNFMCAYGINRAVVRSGFEFNYDNISVAGNVISYIDREYQTNATLDFKFGF